TNRILGHEGVGVAGGSFIVWDHRQITIADDTPRLNRIKPARANFKRCAMLFLRSFSISLKTSRENVPSIGKYPRANTIVAARKKPDGMTNKNPCNNDGA